MRTSCNCSFWPKIKWASILILSIVFTLLLSVFSACGATAKQVQPQASVTIDPHFQTQLSPLPTPPPYRCGAWASNNVPGAYSTLTIYAKLTKDIAGVAGIGAKAVAHFQSGDVTLDQQPITDSNGYVTFNLALAGRQPVMVPTTIEVSFRLADAPKPIQCSAFFTPQ